MNNILHGRGASTGIGVGQSKVISPGERIQVDTPDTVLVMEMTTPEIMPHIRKLAAIVTQIGGVTCHAAIIAREYNIPTVVACKDAYTIPDGVTVIVNADKGTVEFSYGL